MDEVGTCGLGIRQLLPEAEEISSENRWADPNRSMAHLSALSLLVPAVAPTRR